VPGGSLAPGAVTGSRPLAFYNPQRVPFTYDLVVLGQLNQPPAFTSQPNTEGIPGVPYVYQATAADPDGDPLTFSVVSAPPGLSIDRTTGKVTWTPGQGDLSNQAVDLRVDDGRGGSSEQRYTIGVIPAPPNQPPVFTSVPVVDANVNALYSYQATASDPDGDPLTFSIATGPKGLTIDPATGLVTWTPASAQVGSSSVTLQVDDGHGGTAAQAFQIGVQPEKGNYPPVIVSQPVTTALAGQTYTYPVHAIDPDNDPVTYSLTTSPAGMAVDPQSSVVSWPTPPDNALSFDGVHDYASIADAPALHSRDITIEGWFNFRSLNGGVLLVKPLGTNSINAGSYKIWFDGTSIYATYNDGSGFLFGAFLGTQLRPVLGTWYHIAYTVNPDGYSPTSGGGYQALYVNGNQVSFGGTYYFNGKIGYDSNPLLIGADLVDGAIQPTGFVGEMDDIRVWNVSRSQDQIKADMVRRDAGTDSGQVVFLPFDEGTGTVAADQSGSGNNATLSGTGGFQAGWAASDVPVPEPDAPVTVRADDGRGGFDTQSFTIHLTNTSPSTIEGTVFNDVNANGTRDVGDNNQPPPPPPDQTPPLKLIQVSTPVNKQITAIDYYEPDNAVVVTDNYPDGQPHNFDEIFSDGTQAPFSKLAGLSNEIEMATARSGNLGGFKPGDIFATGPSDGQIIRITDGGKTVISPWVALYNTGPFTAFRFDDTGVFGGDLIAMTHGAQIFRITAGGQATEIANVGGVYHEGIAIVPNDPGRYGPLAGKILITSELENRVYAIDPQGNITPYNIPVSAPEDIFLVPPNQNFFGSNQGTDKVPGKVLGAPASEFRSLVGEILISEEFATTGSELFRLFWDGTAVQTQGLPLAPDSAPQGGWEQINFAPAGVAEIPPVPEEPALANWTVYLDLNHNGKLDPGEPSTTTDALGHYALTNLAPGTYTVAEVPQPGWQQTAPATGTQTVTVQAGLVVSGVDFGNTSTVVPNQPP
jgi:hypothetical protein